jgi:hypothetical protein
MTLYIANAVHRKRKLHRGKGGELLLFTSGLLPQARTSFRGFEDGQRYAASSSVKQL